MRLCIKSKMKDLFLKIWKDPVLSKVIATAIIALATVVWVWVSGIGTRSLGNKSTEPKMKKVVTNVVGAPVLAEGRLPYHQNVAILDKTLYIKYSYADFIVGGKNISKIKIAARTNDGAAAKFETGLLNPLEIEHHIPDKPYLEFEYGNHFYSIEVSGDSGGYQYTLREISNVTMDLEPIPLK